MHDDEMAPYLRTSDAGVAHVVTMSHASAKMHFRDSPYTWGAPRGFSDTSLCLDGRWRPYEMRSHGCIPPLVCSRMRSEVANMEHTEVNFEHPTWLKAMLLCEEEELPEQQAHKTTLVRFI